MECGVACTSRLIGRPDGDSRSRSGMCQCTRTWRMWSMTQWRSGPPITYRDDHFLTFGCSIRERWIVGRWSFRSSNNTLFEFSIFLTPSIRHVSLSRNGGGGGGGWRSQNACLSITVKMADMKGKCKRGRDRDGSLHCFHVSCILPPCARVQCSPALWVCAIEPMSWTLLFRPRCNDAADLMWTDVSSAGQSTPGRSLILLFNLLATGSCTWTDSRWVSRGCSSHSPFFFCGLMFGQLILMMRWALVLLCFLRRVEMEGQIWGFLVWILRIQGCTRRVERNWILSGTRGKIFSSVYHPALVI